MSTERFKNVTSFVINLLNNKTIILLNPAEYRLILTASSAKYQTIFRASQRKNFNISFLLFNMEGNQTRVTESSNSDIKKLMASAVPESTKKSLKYALNDSVNVFEGEKSHEQIKFSLTQII